MSLLYLHYVADVFFFMSQMFFLSNRLGPETNARRSEQKQFDEVINTFNSEYNRFNSESNSVSGWQHPVEEMSAPIRFTNRWAVSDIRIFLRNSDAMTFFIKRIEIFASLEMHRTPKIEFAF